MYPTAILAILTLSSVTLATPIETSELSKSTSSKLYVNCPTGSRYTEGLVHELSNGSDAGQRVAVCCPAGSGGLSQWLEASGPDFSVSIIVCVKGPRQQIDQHIEDPHRQCLNGATIWEEHSRACKLPEGA